MKDELRFADVMQAETVLPHMIDALEGKTLRMIHCLQEEDIKGTGKKYVDPHRLAEHRDIMLHNIELARLYVDKVTEPARPDYVLTMIRALLTQYFVAEMPDEDRAVMHRSWQQALSTFPRWALQKAYEEWTNTGHNGRSPASGDIAELARGQMGTVLKLRMASDMAAKDAEAA